MEDRCVYKALDDENSLHKKLIKELIEEQNKRLSELYAGVVETYIEQFQQKQEVDCLYWIADNVGGIIDCSDRFLNFHDIKYDIDNNVPVGMILDWYDYSVDEHLEGKTPMNFENYVKLNRKEE